MHEWVYRTLESLSPQKLHTNELVLLDSHVYLADATWPSFPEWVDHLAARDPVDMRDDVLQALLAQVGNQVDGEIYSPAELLADRQAYLALRASLSNHHEERPLWEEIYALLQNPPALQALVTGHLRTMWDETLAPEWERNLSMLEDSVAAFQSLNLQGLSAVDAVRRVVMREVLPEGSAAWLAQLERIIFLPSVHTGPYLLRLSSLSETETRFVFGARIPEGVVVRAPALTRSELLIRLSALADDTRLRILQLLGERGELGTPEVRDLLEASQSSTARHLEHLTATGYLVQRRQGGVNLYRLNRERVDHTFQALKEFCG
jgi:DNA-binding transcriptional ArsR family regulator